MAIHAPRQSHAVLVALVAAWAISNPGAGQAAVVPTHTIGINFWTDDQFNSAPLFVPNNLEAGAPGVRQRFWNDAPVGSNDGSGALSSLQDAAGNATSASVVWVGSDGVASDWQGVNADELLFNGVLINGLGPVQATVLNLPQRFIDNTYDVYVYLDYEFFGLMQSISLLENGNQVGLVSAEDVMTGVNLSGPPNTFVQPGDYMDATLSGVGNYVVFSGLDYDTFTVVANGGDAVSFMNAIQIVAVPEPGTLSLAALGSLLALGTLRRLRRKKP